MTPDRSPDPVPAAGAAADPGRPARGLRLLDGLAGLLAAGVLVLGVVLLLAALIAPSLLAAAGLGSADGPGWDRVLAHLGVGVAGELVVRFRRSWPTAVRAIADCAVVSVAVLLIWWAWIP